MPLFRAGVNRTRYLSFPKGVTHHFVFCPNIIGANPLLFYPVWLQDCTYLFGLKNKKERYSLGVKLVYLSYGARSESRLAFIPSKCRGFYGEQAGLWLACPGYGATIKVGFGISYYYCF